MLRLPPPEKNVDDAEGFQLHNRGAGNFEVGIAEMVLQKKE